MLQGGIGVVGAGVMGAGIAQVLAVAGHQVICLDRSPDALKRARREVEAGRYGLRSAVTRGLLEQSAADDALARLAFSEDALALADVGLVVEAVPEDLALKIDVFRMLDRTVRPGAVLTTNSSGFPVAALAAATDRPELVLGWHWASPAPVMKLAEIVTTGRTSDDAVQLVVGLASAAGKNPVLVRDDPTSWGYVANRIYAAAYAEAQRIVAGGIAEPAQVDQLMVDCFRWPSGPFKTFAGAQSGWSEDAPNS